MTQDEFIKNNVQTWKNLEEQYKVVSKKQHKRKLDKIDIDNFIVLYNSVTNHLAYSRTNFGNCELTRYLNKLSALAHGVIYTSPKPKVKDFFLFFAVGFPVLFRKYMKPFILATGLFILGALFAFIITTINVENSFELIGKEMATNLRQEGEYDAKNNAISAYSASTIGTNNIQVSFLAFSLGVTLGIGTIYVLIINGFSIGALAGIFLLKKQSLFFWSLILPHGITELFSIFVCGAAGLIIGYSLVNPKEMSRKDAFIIKAKDAIKLVCGTIPILIISAIIEGYFTPLNLPYIYKYLFALIMLVLLILYLSLPGRKRKNNTFEKVTK